jgi:SAM-dependent methyltransferase
MNVFGHYARYYDLLYKDKDYAGEAEYVHTLIQRHSPKARSILELGCGTAAHARLFAAKGYELHGVDRSAEMLEQARNRLGVVTPEQAGRLSFSQGDVRDVRLNRKFDAVISLFHVISYQVMNADLAAAFATARAHLDKGGIFIFDCWYGPAVLTDRPVVRIKRLEDDSISVTRIAEPIMRPNENLVEVNYHVFIRDKKSKKVEELKETHRMRYLFRPEVDNFLSENGLSVIEEGEWMTGKELGFGTWGGCFVAKRTS